MEYVIANYDPNLSFPTRERGLKSAVPGNAALPHVSFPTRERVLKYKNKGKHYSLPLSFPTRERGLKLHHLQF